MRGTVVARRALLAFAGGFVASPFAGELAAAHGGHGPRHNARRLPIIAIDPGHGGIDPGAISPHGVFEKTITLATAGDLARALAASGRYHPLLTRRGDVFIALRSRVARAHAGHADLFLSIHADALPDSALRGLSVYTLSEQASDRLAAGLARRENHDDFVDGVHLSRQPREIAGILFDLARRQTENRSLLLARDVVAQLGREVPLLERPHRSAAFVVLTSPEIPSVLVEIGCLSNPQDERLLQQPAHRRRLAHGLAAAIDAYFARTVAA